MKNLSKSWRDGVFIALVACITGIAIRMLHLSAPTWLLPFVSLMAFAIGTIGRIGWELQTWDGRSPTEIWDHRLFLSCYYVGIVAGVVCLPV